MKKISCIIIAGVIIFALSSCGQRKDLSIDIGSGVMETDSTDEAREVQSNDIYEGEFSDYDVNEPSLEIKRNDDATYLVQIKIYRMWYFDDGIGKATEEGLKFAATGPAGKEVKGVIKVEEDVAAVTFLSQAWIDFAGSEVYKFYKTSDTPNIYTAKESTTLKDVTEDVLEMTAEELFDLFINGSIDAIDCKDGASTFNIADFEMDSEEENSYAVGERMDLDNDGENELIICGSYGGIYLDARSNQVYEFAVGDGNANVLSYTYYNGEVWILYSDTTNVGDEYYHMEKYEGADNLTAEMSFSAELVDANHPKSGTKYLLNGNEISYDEYTAFCSKIFAAEESTILQAPTEEEALELYADVLQGYLSMGKTDFTVSFIDLNQDCTREMIVFFGESHTDGGVLFTIRNGEAVQVEAEGRDSFGQYGGFTYKKGENVFVTEEESVTATQISDQIYYYTMEDGSAVCKDMTQSITQFDMGESEFYVNGTKVDSEEFDSIAEGYGLSEMETVSYSDSVRVANGKMAQIYKAYHQ